jgi:hypothetical protein
MAHIPNGLSAGVRRDSVTSKRAFTTVLFFGPVQFTVCLQAPTRETNAHDNLHKFLINWCARRDSNSRPPGS